jgi:hypothetical protein
MAGVIALEFIREEVNPSLLREECAAALGTKFVGISRAGARLRAHVLDSTTRLDRARIEAIVRAHDPSRLSTEQQQNVAQAALMEALRKPWREWSAADKDLFLRALAQAQGLID